MPAVTTVTFFKGASAADAAASLRMRMANVVAANPWVAGRVVKERGEKMLTMLHPAEGEAVPDDVMGELVRLDPPDMPPLHAEMDFDEMVKIVSGSSAMVPQLSKFA